MTVRPSSRGVGAVRHRTGVSSVAAVGDVRHGGTGGSRSSGGGYAPTSGPPAEEGVVQLAVLIVASLVALALAGASIRAALAERARRRSMVDLGPSLRRGDEDLDVAGAVARAAKDPDPIGPDLEEVLIAHTDYSSFRPTLAPWVQIKVFHLPWGNDYAVAANLRDLVHFRFEVWEAELMGKMDGSHTVGELVVGGIEERGFDPDGVSSLVSTLEEEGFFTATPVDAQKAVAEAIKPAAGPATAIGAFLRTLQVSWDGAERFVDAWYRGGMRLFFRPGGFIPATLIAAVGLVAFFDVERSGRFTLGVTTAAAESLVLLALALGLTFFHELGHALVLVHNGRRIKNAGFALYFGSPAFFVEATDGLMLDRWQRITQSLAGPFSELVLAGVASVIVWRFPTWGGSQLLYKFAVLNYLVIFLNLVPLLELDGYWLLSDLIQVPDLRPRSLEFTQHDLWHKVRGRERLTLQEFGLAVYGILGAVFTVFVLIGTAYFWRERFGGLLTSLWNGGLVGRTLLALLILFVGGPVIRGGIAGLRAIGRRGLSIFRRIRFRRETSWRVEAAELIDALPAFESLPEDLLSDLAGHVRLASVHPGQPIFRQGDRATAFFVIRRGTVRVETEHPDTGDVEVLNTLGRGEAFGELGLLGAAPRSATVRAEDEVELFTVDKGTFDRLLADEIRAPEFGHTLQSLAELRELSPFRHLQASELADVLAHGGWITAAPGQELIREGDIGDAFYAIGAGQVEVIHEGATIRSLGPGGYFGELALLRNAPRSATVIARTPVRAFRLDRNGFDHLLADAFRSGALRDAIDRTWEH
ncbi:MAG: cyclic nucleotide-binding domain-containing protein [Actinobacteria bacterium]|nr:MAG: cyclic nucleotide-binding domain-containing protein [Actinomycetota bacterium]